MVLENRLFRLVSLSLLLTLSACSSNSIRPSDRPSLVAVEKEAGISQPTKVLQTSISASKKSTEKVTESSAPSKALSPAGIENSNPPLESNILETLLGKAKKAMEAQQWLRAQRVLEQALRVDPLNPEIFIRYGDVYANMGLKDKALSMYQRAAYLGNKARGFDSRVERKILALEE